MNDFDKTFGEGTKPSTKTETRTEKTAELKIPQNLTPELTPADLKTMDEYIEELDAKFQEEEHWLEESGGFTEHANEQRNKRLDETILQDRERSASKEIACASNEVFYVKLKDDGLGVFKPKSGESKYLRHAVKYGTFYKRERAAYLVDEYLDFDLVPATVIREIDDEHGVGSLQRFINAKTLAETSPEDFQGTKEDKIKLWIFDYIIWNSDRHDGNLMIGKDKKIHAIDNGLSFGNDFFGPLSEHYHEPIPKDIIEKIQNFINSDQKNALIQELKELLPLNEVRACIKRIENLNLLLTRNRNTDPEPRN